MIDARTAVLCAGLGAAAFLPPSGTRLAGAAPAPTSGEVAGFDTATPVARWDLPDTLREVSGLAAAGLGRVLAHTDESGHIVEIDYRNGTLLRQWRLGSPLIHEDFEGIELVGQRVTLMTSDGRLFSGDLPANGAVISPVTVHDTGLGRLCELEGLGVGQDGSWLLPCKTPHTRDRRHLFVIYSWPESKPATRRAGLTVLQGRRQQPLHPTAVLQTTSGSFVVLFGPERAIGEFAADGTTIALVKLDERRHPKPEGLAITLDGTLLIADEGPGEHGRGTMTAYGPAR